PTSEAALDAASKVTSIVAVKQQFEALVADLPNLMKTDFQLAYRVRDAIPVFNMAFLSADVYFEHSIPELLPKGYARLEGDAQLKEVGLTAAALYDNDS